MSQVGPVEEEIEIKLLLEAIYLKYRSDFREYSMASIRRRVRLALTRLKIPTVTELIARLLENPADYDRLLGYLTVPTSEMFRDPSYFKVLRDQVFPVLRTYPSIKVWIAGCSTGEEIYSMAILLEEEGLLDRALLYATDINPASLERAKAGIYPMDRLRLFTTNYQKAGGKREFATYYQANYEGAIFSRHLRSNVVFADHSLATDTVFAEVQLVSCRNVLIYFNRSLQDRAVGLFQESLSNRAFLGLGAKETLRFSRHQLGFEEFNAEEKIYRKKGAVR